MARKCTICTHPDREFIDRAIVDGEANRAIARQFRVSKDAVARHAENHSPAVLVEAKQEVKLTHASDLWGRIDARAWASGIREARACLELLVRAEAASLQAEELRRQDEAGSVDSVQLEPLMRMSDEEFDRIARHLDS